MTAGSRRSTGCCKQDVELIDVGHYSPATKAEIAAERDYMIDLHQAGAGFSQGPANRGTSFIAMSDSAMRCGNGSASTRCAP